MTTAFVLSGGASLGAVQVGMLRALYERGIQPDLIVGTSAGAVNGAFVAGRPQTVETAEELAAIWRRLRRGHVFPLSPLTGLLGLAGGRDHLVSDSGLRRLIGRHLTFERLQDAPIPVHVVAVDVVTGQEELLSTGDALEAVLASASIPGVLPPVRWDGERTLMDGGVANNTPISHAIELGADRLYVLPTGEPCALEKSPGSALAMALNALSLLTQRRLIDDIARNTEEAQLIVLPPPCPLRVAPIDFSRAEELIDRAYSDAADFFERGGAEQPPIRMHLHRHRRTGRGKTAPLRDAISATGSL